MQFQFQSNFSFFITKICMEKHFDVFFFLFATSSIAKQATLLIQSINLMKLNWKFETYCRNLCAWMWNVPVCYFSTLFQLAEKFWIFYAWKWDLMYEWNLRQRNIRLTSDLKTEITLQTQNSKHFMWNLESISSV